MSEGGHDVNAWRRVHLVGIGGAGMSGIARLLLARGIEVSGSDLKESRNLAALREAGAIVHVGHRAGQVDRPDVLVVSSAIPPGNVEVRVAKERAVRVIARAEALAALMLGRRSVAVAGTHGKTTTTSMISVVLARTGRSPSYVIGGDLNESGSGAGHGTGDVFVAEADESDGSFLLLRPDVAVITNVEADHLDFYRGPEDVERAFGSFAGTARRVVACWDDPGVRRAIRFGGDHGGVVRYGAGPDGEVRVRDIGLSGDGSRCTIDVTPSAGFPGRPWTGTLHLRVPGLHNVLNAAAAVAVAALLDVAPSEAVPALGTFTGVRRRFEHRGEVAGTEFFDDYAHHPTELAATLATARLRRPRRLVAVFQPHRYSRTGAMWRALGESLGSADLAVVTDVFGAGEAVIPGVTGKLLATALAEARPGKRVVYLPRRSDVVAFLAGEIRPGDLVLTLGAGDITMTGDEVLERIRGASP